jgi:phosphoenolpyruvate carboxykinase (ATP)
MAEPFFGLPIPTSCPGVPAEVLNPRNTWSDQAAYDDMARKLATMFTDNFTMFDSLVSPEIKQAGPRI